MALKVPVLSHVFGAVQVFVELSITDITPAVLMGARQIPLPEESAVNT